jgi:hypothetical protein
MTKIARIKLNLLDQITIYDIVIAQALLSICNKLIIYIDDREMTRDNLCSDDTDYMIDTKISILKKFNIRIDGLIRYTDYYNMIWIYMHRLTYLKKVLINYNSDKRPDDLYHVMAHKNNMKIYLEYEGASINKYDNILYDSGWIRELFMEAIIDDAEKIEYGVNILETHVPSPGFQELSTSMISKKTIEVNHNIMMKLAKILKLHRPTYVLVDLIERIIKLKHRTRLQEDISLDNLSPDQLHTIGIGVNKIREMIDDNNISLLGYTWHCNETIDLDQQHEPGAPETMTTGTEQEAPETMTTGTEQEAPETTGTGPDIITGNEITSLSQDTPSNPDTVNPCNNIWGMIDPIIIVVNEPKKVIVNDHSVIIINHALCIEKSAMGNNFTKRIKLKYAGIIQINLENNKYYGKWIRGGKKKKIKQYKKWLPVTENNIHRLDGDDKLIIFYPTHDLDNIKIFKIRSNYYIKNNYQTNTLSRINC